MLTSIASQLITSPAATGLGGLAVYLRDNYIGPGFIILVMVVAIVLAAKQKIAAFLGFLAVAIVAAVFIYGGEALFGSGGTLTTAGKELAKNVNVVFSITPTLISDALSFVKIR